MADEYIKKQPLLDKAKEMSGDVFAAPRIIAEIENAPVYSLDLHKEEVENLIKYHPLTKYPTCVIVGVVDALIYTKSPEDYYEFLRSIKTKAYKELLEKFKEKAEKTIVNCVVDTAIVERETGWLRISLQDFDNIVKELE